MQLVATPDTDCYFFSRTHSISVSHMSVELVQFMSQLLNLMFIQIFKHVKIAEKAVDSERTFLFLLRRYFFF